MEAREGLVSFVSEAMYRRILVPTDFSEYADQAVSHAVGLARRLDAEVVFFHAFIRPMVPSLPAGDRAVRRYLDEAVRAVASQLEALAESVEGVACRAITREGRPAEEIVSVAASESCDLICMSTHGHGGLAHVFLGSVAERVIHRAPCPVLAVRVVTPRRAKARRTKKRRRARGAKMRVDEDGE